MWVKAIDEYISFLLIAGSNVCQDADWLQHFKLSVEFRVSIVLIVETRNEKIHDDIGLIGNLNLLFLALNVDCQT